MSIYIIDNGGIGVDWTILLFVLVGVLAQTIDGSIGMAYGVSSNSLLLSLGVPAAAASASVHTAEIFTTLVSGISHWKLKNIDKKLFLSLVIPGVIGGVIGALILSNLEFGILKVIVSVYLILMGVRILYKAFRKPVEKKLDKVKTWFIGVLGGLLDAIGGGGWGPVVTTTLVADGHTPRYVIGTVNTSEFFVTLAQTIIFFSFLGLGEFWKIIVGLAIGGVIAAPFAAMLVKKISPKAIMITVGIAVIVLNVRTIILYFIK